MLSIKLIIKSHTNKDKDKIYLLLKKLSFSTSIIILYKFIILKLSLTIIKSDLIKQLNLTCLI